MSNIVTVAIENVYGRQTIYPVDETARIFARIAGTKTLTPTTMKLIKQLDYVVEIKQQAEVW